MNAIGVFELMQQNNTTDAAEQHNTTNASQQPNTNAMHDDDVPTDNISCPIETDLSSSTATQNMTSTYEEEHRTQCRKLGISYEQPIPTESPVEKANRKWRNMYSIKTKQKKTKH